MKPLFPRRAAATGSVRTPEAKAYREGRIDERRAETRAGPQPWGDSAPRAGRAQEPVRRRGAPLISLIVFLIVVFGAIMLYLAAKNGSFAQGGAVIDHSLSNAAAPVRRAEDKTGATLEHAGERLKQDAGPAAH
jgi:hypothetical protein